MGVWERDREEKPSYYPIELYTFRARFLVNSVQNEADLIVVEERVGEIVDHESRLHKNLYQRIRLRLK